MLAAATRRLQSKACRFLRSTGNFSCVQRSEDPRVCSPLIPTAPVRMCFTSGLAQPEYEEIEGAERLERYREGGYHPVDIGDLLHRRYEIVDKLGYGGWSTVWLANDHHLARFVAVKIGVANSLRHEATILRALSTPPNGRCPASIPRLLDEFILKGPNGSHPCFVTPPALCNLRQSSFSRLFRVDVARALAYELTLAVAFVHSQGFVHGGILSSTALLDHLLTIVPDIHLRNILLRARPTFHNMSIKRFREIYGEPVSNPIHRLDGLPLTRSIPSKAIVPLDLSKNAREVSISEARLMLNDFGESFDPNVECRLGKDCHTPVDFRPPEATFEPDKPLLFAADIWMLATAIWDILGMQSLFSSAFYSDTKVICQMVDTLGPLPTGWQQNWTERKDFFDEEGLPCRGRYVWPRLKEAFEERVLDFRREDNMGIFSDEETKAILSMMKQMLTLQPGDRATIEEVLRSDWMVKWAKKAFEMGQHSQ